MKVTNWRKKLATTLVASGLISPTAALAANLNTNLVLNGSFESVDFGITGTYGSPRINDWTGISGFVYSHDPGTTGIPDYADGDDPPGAGQWYFTANNNPGSVTGDIRLPGEVYQDVDVSTGPSGTAIAAGRGRLKMGAWMSSYLNDNDYGIVHVDYLDIGGNSLGFAQLQDSDPGPENVWNLNTGFSPIIPGTATLRISVLGGVVDSGTDGYIDLVDVQIEQTANSQFVFLDVNTTTGQMQVVNQTGAPIPMDYYEIISASGSLRVNNWSSLQDQNLAGFPAGNGTGNGWEEAGGSSATILSESYLTGNSSLANNSTLSLGAGFTPGAAQDLVFNLAVIEPGSLAADFDADGDADGADLLIWQRGFGTANATKAQGNADGDSDVDAADLAVWKSEFGTAGGGGGTGVLQRGFVRYVTGAAAAAVPEPSALLLAGIGVVLVAANRGQRRRQD